MPPCRAPGRSHTLQLQDEFSGLPLSTLSRLKLEIYAHIPDFRDRCPLCGGANCAVRHGLYYRGVLDRGGEFYESFPVPRFRCRRRGRSQAVAVTFSVLPSTLMPCKRPTLPLLLHILSLWLLSHSSIADTLDKVATCFRHMPQPWVPEHPTLYRMQRFAAGVHDRLAALPTAEVALQPVDGDSRARACSLLLALKPLSRAPPIAALAFHRRHFPYLLFDLRRGPEQDRCA